MRFWVDGGTRYTPFCSKTDPTQTPSFVYLWVTTVRPTAFRRPGGRGTQTQFRWTRCAAPHPSRPEESVSLCVRTPERPIVCISI